VTDGGLSLVTGQIICGALLMAPLGIAGGLPHLPSSPAPVLAMLGLGALGSGLAFVLNFEVIREIGSAAASTVTYLIPLFAVLVGVAFLGEAVSWNEPLGGLVVLLGVAFSQGQARSLAGRIGRVFGRSAELASD
jgi:drug/metabolite transporter (DMT)-like permease